MDGFRDMAIQNNTRRLTAVILDLVILVQLEIAPFDAPISKTLPLNQTKWIGWPVAEIWPITYSILV